MFLTANIKCLVASPVEASLEYRNCPFTEHWDSDNLKQTSLRMTGLYPRAVLSPSASVHRQWLKTWRPCEILVFMGCAQCKQQQIEKREQVQELLNCSHESCEIRRASSEVWHHPQSRLRYLKVEIVVAFTRCGDGRSQRSLCFSTIHTATLL